MDDSNSLVQMSSSGPPNKHLFNHYKVITIDYNFVSGTGTHENFPVLISILDSDLHDDVQSNGNDIAFANDTAWLDHDIILFNQTYNITHAELMVWVQIPYLNTDKNTVITMFYGNSTMGSQENPEGVWDSDYEGVYHLDDDFLDATDHNRDGINTGSVDVKGKIGDGQDFERNDNTDNINIGTWSVSGFQLTIQAWVKFESFSRPDARILSKCSGNSDLINEHVWMLGTWDTPTYRQRGRIKTGTSDSSGTTNIIATSGNLSIDTWYLTTLKYDGSNISFALNGIPVGSISKTGSLRINNWTIMIGNSPTLTKPLDAVIDEVRISSTIRSDDWLKTEYVNQYDPDSFYTFGIEYTVSGDPPNDHYFEYYKEIIIDHTMVSGLDDLFNFPVLISSFDSDLHDDVQSNGNDIVFAYNGAWLDHEIELFNQTYNTTHAQLIAWVRITRLSTSLDTIIRMYYGNSTMGTLENPEGVWNSNYRAVWHLSEDPTGIIYDSTSNNKDGTSSGSMTSGDQIAGKINGGIDFDGNDDTLDFGMWDSSTDFNPSSGTFSFWISRQFLDSVLNNQMVLSMRESGENRIMFRYDGGDYEWRFHHEGQNYQSVVYPSSSEIPRIEWIYVVQTWDVNSDFNRGYINGSLFGSTSGLYDPTSGSWSVYLASNRDSDGYYYGKLDEVRISDLYRTDGWIATEYQNQDDPNTFYSIGKEYTVSGNPPNEHYFKYYKEIIIDHTMVSGSHDLINFPLLISTLDEDLQDKAQEEGYDIAFTYNGAWLDHEIELFNQTYNTTHAQLITWVSIPRLSTSENTVVRMYYGNSTMTSQENPTGVWSNNYKGVWHLSESAGSALDSTFYSTAGSVSGTVTRDPVGKIDGAYNFGDTGQILFGNPPDGHLDMGIGSFTISFWLNIDDTTGYYQLPLYKGATTDNEEGYDFETGMDASALSFRITDGTGVVSTSNIDIDFDSWIYVVGVVDRSSDLIKIFENGQPVGSGTSITGVGNLDNDIPLRAPPSIYSLDGLLDEIRISNIAHSAGWIATEYNNQYYPLSFLTIGSEESFDITPPNYSNLIESSDPLELGDTEVITINVSDLSGINLVQIEFMGSNHSMNNTSGDTWQYDSWTPSSVDNYTYTIWMQDNYYNWNFTSDSIEVRDTNPPTYSDLIESADPLQMGQNETISIKVYDLSGVNQVLLEYNSSNHTMSFIGGNTWSWNKWNASLGNHSYIIFMQDMENNWNMTSGTITVVSTTAPLIENLTESDDPLELGNIITITVDVDDNESVVEVVFIELDGVNHTMTNISGITYEYNWTRSSIGLIYYTIYANDTDNNWNSLTSSFEIVDTTPPAFSDLSMSEDPLELGNTVTISVNSTDLSDINQVKIEFMGSNHSMTNISSYTWLYDSWSPNSVGNHTYTIWAEDNNNNWDFISDSIVVRDTTLPIYSDLTESSNPVELGEELIITINATDLADIKDVSIELENSNHTMTNIGSDIWQYNSWVPTSIGNHTYRIYIADNNDNLNYISSWILFQDTIIPVFSNLFESADPLELGDDQIIRIDVYDFADINQCLIEFEGANHSMTNIYGDTWQYDSWTPTKWIVYQYKIHMEDISGNWNLIVSNITVQDTNPPSLPLLANSPSGDVSGTLLFDWSDGYDPSGIFYYILIIDNETDPYVTPGYVCFVNITNVGSDSSYYELSEVLPLGRYYYFLAQVDGVGYQSSFTMGTFTVISIENGAPGNNNLIFIIIIVASVIGSATAIVIVRKRSKKGVTPRRKKIPLKVISSHIIKLSNSQPSFQAEESEGITIESKQKLTDEKELEIRINEIKNVGEELFAEGAYLEAQKQFILGRDLLLNLGRQEEAKLFTELISGIEGLIEERENRLEILEKFKNEGNSSQIFELYQDVIDISKKLRDPDTTSFYQFELILYFQNNELNIVDLERYRFELSQKADSLSNNNIFEMAAQLYGKCEKISELLVQLEREKEVAIIEEFRNRKNECLKKINNK